MSGYEQRASYLRDTLQEISPEDALRMVNEQGALLIDVRDSDEIKQGMPEPAQHLSRSYLELRIHDLCGEKEHPIAVLCAGGLRSLFAAESLKNLGYTNVYSIRGGYKGWKEAALKSKIPTQLNERDKERYARHLQIPEVGESGQIKLMQSKVLLLGAGGLGSPAALYLAAAGVGTIGIVDADIVESSNLQRQVIHGEDKLGMLKVESAASAIHRLNSSVKVQPHPIYLDESNALEILSGYDLVIDGTDNFKTRYLINDACVKLGIPNVHGAVYRFEGYVTTFTANSAAPCYRCIYPEPPPPEMAPSCAEAGVLGVLPGVIGLLQAVEGLKLLLDIGSNLSGRILKYDALHHDFSVLEVEKEDHCLCAKHPDEIVLSPIAPQVCAA